MFVVDVRKMVVVGSVFYIVDNVVWLIDFVFVIYLCELVENVYVGMENEFGVK